MISNLYSIYCYSGIRSIERMEASYMPQVENVKCILHVRFYIKPARAARFFRVTSLLP